MDRGDSVLIKVWGRASSSNVQAVMWAIAEFGLAHERYDAGHIYGVNDTAEFLAMNPNGKVPVVQDGSNPPLWETGAILRYLSGKYANDRFWPSDPEARAHVDKWAEWAKINVSIKFTGPIFWRVVRTAPSRQDPAAIRQAIDVLNTSLAIADAQLSKHAFLASSEFTLADIQFGQVLYRYFNIEIDRVDFPNIESYYARLRRRPHFMRHVAVSYEELRVRD